MKPAELETDANASKKPTSEQRSVETPHHALFEVLGHEGPGVRPRPSRHRLAFIVLVACSVVIASIVYFIQKASQPPAPAPASTSVTPDKYLTSQNRVFCGQPTASTLLCEDVVSHAVSKFNLPKSLGKVEGLIPSPDGKLILVESGTNFVSNQKVSREFVVIDRKFGLVKRLPSQSYGQDGFDYQWSRDSKSLVYGLRAVDPATQQYGLSQLYMYDLTSGQARQLTNRSEGPYAPRFYEDGNIVAVTTTQNSVDKAERLVMISAKDGSLKVIDKTPALGEGSRKLEAGTRFIYQPASGYFYARVNGPETDNKLTTIVAELRSSADGLALKRVASYAVEGLEPDLTSVKGTLVDVRKVGNLTYKLAATGTRQTDLKLKKDKLNLLIATPGLPFDKPAESSGIVASDYLFEFQTPPARVHDFVTTLVHEGCEPGQSKPVTLYGFDSDQQIVVGRGACDPFAPGSIAYYIYKNGKYELATAGQGIDCAEAVKLGISRVILPNCIPEGQR